MEKIESTVKPIQTEITVVKMRTRREWSMQIEIRIEYSRSFHGTLMSMWSICAKSFSIADNPTCDIGSTRIDAAWKEMNL